MNMSYPATLKNYKGGQVGVFFAGVPEAITAGTNELEALDRASKLSQLEASLAALGLRASVSVTKISLDSAFS